MAYAPKPVNLPRPLTRHLTHQLAERLPFALGAFGVVFTAVWMSVLVWFTFFFSLNIW
jgi:hypothetical protein